MNPLIALIVAELAKQLPVLALDIIQLLSKEAVTEADWAALRDRWDKPASSFYKTPPAE